MKNLFGVIIALFFLNMGFGQEIVSDSLFQPNQPGHETGTVKPAATPRENPEKIAWDMMLPAGYKKQAKSTEKVYFENLLLSVKSGVAELSLEMGEFETRPVEKNRVPPKKKTRPVVAGGSE